MKNNQGIHFLKRITNLLRNTPLSSNPFLINLQERILSVIYSQKKVEMDGFSIKIHSPREFISKKLILNKSFERREIQILNSVIKPGDIVLDVGANIGIYTLYLSRAVGKAGKVFAFEPDPENFEILQENIQINECNNVTAFPVALGDTSTYKNLYVCSSNKDFQSFSDLSASTKSIPVQVERAEDLIVEKEISLMKLDVEGSEPLVWKGMGSIKPKFLLLSLCLSSLHLVEMILLSFWKL
jgi:FkbM family methyltransferase